MIKINLLSEGKPAGARRKAAAAPEGGGLNAAFIMAGLVAGLVFVAWRYWDLNSDKKNLNDEISKKNTELKRLESVLKQVEEFEAKKLDLENKINLINELKRNQRGPVRIMDEISTAVPDLLWLSSLVMAGERLAIKGQALNPNAVANFLENLGRSEYFQEPILEDTTEGKDFYTFALNVGFSYTPRSALPPPGETPGMAASKGAAGAAKGKGKS